MSLLGQIGFTSFRHCPPAFTCVIVARPRAGGAGWLCSRFSLRRSTRPTWPPTSSIAAGEASAARRTRCSAHEAPVWPRHSRETLRTAKHLAPRRRIGLEDAIRW